MTAFRPLRAALALGCAAILSACATSAQMSQMSNQAWNQVLSEEPVSNDPALDQRAQRVASRIISGAGLQNQNWQVVVFDSDEQNAFALPGGQIGVYRGMMNLANTDDQLAAVIGHEVGHVVAGHAMERYNQQMGTAVGAQVVGAALGGQGFGSAEQISQVFGLGAQVGILLPYSRGNESEADLLGIDYMVRAGYDPRAAVTLWEKMAAQGGSRGPAFLSTHPDPRARAQEIEGYIAQRGY